jgi:hypothetical protein
MTYEPKALMSGYQAVQTTLGCRPGQKSVSRYFRLGYHEQSAGDFLIPQVAGIVEGKQQAFDQ